MSIFALFVFFVAVVLPILFLVCGMLLLKQAKKFGIAFIVFGCFLFILEIAAFIYACMALGKMN